MNLHEHQFGPASVPSLTYGGYIKVSQLPVAISSPSGVDTSFRWTFLYVHKSPAAAMAIVAIKRGYFLNRWNTAFRELLANILQQHSCCNNKFAISQGSCREFLIFHNNVVVFMSDLKSMKALKVGMPLGKTFGKKVHDGKVWKEFSGIGAWECPYGICPVISPT